MNDMSGNFTCATPVGQISGLAGVHRAARLSPPRAFTEATALVEEALAQLRSAESALERQLGDLRAYMNLPAITVSN